MTSEGSEAHEAAIRSDTQEPGTAIEIRQIKALNNLIAQDHRGVRRVTRPMPGGNAREAAASTLVGIALMPRLRKGQLTDGIEQGLTPAEPCYALAS